MKPSIDIPMPIGSCDLDPSPDVLVIEKMRAYRLDGMQLAASIIKYSPRRLHGITIGDFLLQIPFVNRECASEWLRRAGVNPWRPGELLTRRERMLIVGQLIAHTRIAID